MIIILFVLNILYYIIVCLLHVPSNYGLKFEFVELVSISVIPNVSLFRIQYGPPTQDIALSRTTRNRNKTNNVRIT
jgi:hypothetical protein